MSVLLESLVRDSFAEPKRRTVFDELGAFLAVGGSGALGFFLLSLGAVSLRTGVPDWIVSAACYAAMIGPVYLAHRRFSFDSDAPHRQALPRYVAVQLSALSLASLFSFVCYSVLGLQSVVAALLVTGLTSGVNFFVLKLWAFAGRD